MPADVLLLVATALLAVVAIGAAAVAVRAGRRAARTTAVAPAVTPVPAHPVRVQPVEAAEPRVGVLEPYVPDTTTVHRPEELAPRVVEGRVMVPPSRDQVVATALSRPQARLAVVASGVAHALRPESRDRIVAMVRRAYRERRRDRLRAGRRAARAAHPTTADADRWLGELP